jgi:hypothetical protein
MESAAPHCAVLRLSASVLVAGVLLGAALPAQTSRPTWGPDLAVLLSGVKDVASPGVPGPVAVFGPRAFPVVSGREGEEKVAVVAAARAGEGRVVAFGHGGYFSREGLFEGSTMRLVTNAVRWSGGAREKPRCVAWRLPAVADALDEEKLPTRRLDDEDCAAALRDADVVVFDVARLRRPDDAARVRAFVEAGGGAVVAGLGWGWLQTHPGKNLAEHHLGNRALASAGLAFADRYADRVGPATEEVERLLPLSAPWALARLAEIESRGEKADAKVLAGLAVAVEIAAASAPRDDALFRPALNDALRTVPVAEQPSEKKPLHARRALARIRHRLERFAEEETPPERRRAHPAATDFPGDVPADAQPTAARVVAEPGAEGWISTGLYASPGRVVTVTAAAGASLEGWTLRFGAHTDENWHHREWKRHPDVAREFPLAGASAKAASPFGGLLYLEASRKTRAAGGTFDVSGAFAAPRFVLGKTDLATWNELRFAPAPWGEFETSKVILTFEAKHARGIADPTPILAFWDSVLDYYPELSTRPAPKRPWRIVNDVQISAGYMHSGYPIMTHLDVGATMLDPAALGPKDKGWGFWHELGHNHQIGDWTFEGTGEVTNNLWSLYVVERVAKKDLWAILRERDALKSAAKHLAEKGGFDAWKKDPFLALVMYAQVVDAFGWDAIKKAFAAYRDAPAAEEPRSDSEKRDVWLRRLSAATGRNLGPFFDAWGVPVTDVAKAAVAHLPAWEPKPPPR